MKNPWVGLVLINLFILFGGGMNPMTMAARDSRNVLIIVDPGGTGFCLKVAKAIANRLDEKNYHVRLVKANHFQASDLSEVNLLIMGSPTYARQPSKSLKNVMEKVEDPGMKTILFQTGSLDCSGLQSLEAMARKKRLNVVYSSGILFSKRDESYLAKKIDEIMDEIQ